MAAGIPLSFAQTSDLNELSKFVADINQLQETESITTERAIERYKTGKSTSEIARIEGWLRLLRSWELYREGSVKFPTKASFVNEVNNVRQKAAEEMGKKDNDLSEAYVSYTTERKKYRTARRQLFFARIRKWGAVALGVAAVVVACFGLPAVAGAIAGAIGGAATIGSALGLSVLFGASIFGIYQGVKYVVKTNWERGGQKVAMLKKELYGDEKNPNGLANSYHNAKQHFREAQADHAESFSVYNQIDSLYGTYDVTDEDKEQAKNYAWANIAQLGDEARDRAKYNDMVAQYQTMINNSSKKSDISNAQNWLYGKLDKIPTKAEVDRLVAAIDDRKSYASKLETDDALMGKYYNQERQEVINANRDAADHIGRKMINFSRKESTMYDESANFPYRWPDKDQCAQYAHEAVVRVFGVGYAKEAEVEQKIMEEFQNASRRSMTHFGAKSQAISIAENFKASEAMVAPVVEDEHDGTPRVEPLEVTEAEAEGAVAPEVVPVEAPHEEEPVRLDDVPSDEEAIREVAEERERLRREGIVGPHESGS